MLPGVHKVRAPRADGGVTEFWYAWRGGPRVLRATAASDALLAKEVARLAPAAVALFESQRQSNDGHLLYGLITKYLASQDFANLAPRTQRDRRKFLDRAREEIGDLQLKALRAEGARKSLLKWRGQYASTPKTADELLGSVSIALQWGVDNDEAPVNPIHEFPRLYRSNRAEAIWEEKHLATLYPHCADELRHAVQLAILTGLRVGDLIALPRTALGEHAIVWQTGKSRGRRTVVIPITPALRKLLAEIPRRDSLTVLNSARQRPWAIPGLESAMRRAKLDAKALALKTRGPGAESGIHHLRFHDLRGTAATSFIRAGLDLDEVATILGWKKGRVEEIAARYVSAEAIGLAIVRKLQRNALKTKAVKGGVKGASEEPPEG